MAEEYDDSEDILEGAEYSSKSDLSKAEKVSSQIERCNENRSKEMKEGYFNYDKLGNRITIHDSRKEWVSSVTALKLLLAPEISRGKFDDESFITKEKEFINKWGVEIKPGVKVISLLDESLQTEFGLTRKDGSVTGQRKIEMIKGKFNSNFHRYWDDMVKLYDEIYAALNILVDQCNYFKQEVSY